MGRWRGTAYLVRKQTRVEAVTLMPRTTKLRECRGRTGGGDYIETRQFYGETMKNHNETNRRGSTTK